MGGDVAHDLGLQRAEGFLSADSQHRYGQHGFLKDLIVFCVLREGGQLREACAHYTRDGVSGSEEIASRFVRLRRVCAEVIPDAVEVDALASGNKPLRIRAVEVEMPDAG